ncbi:hypothetical protein ACC713_36535, partial [Rhizobium johnstonii]
GHIDILVNCAAPKGAFVPSIEDVSQVFEQGLSVNLTVAFTCAREAIKVMRPCSVILNLGACADLLRPASRQSSFRRSSKRRSREKLPLPFALN